MAMPMSNNITPNASPASAAGVSAINGPGGSGGLLNVQKDAKESAQGPKFGDVLNQLQAQYGAKAQKPREIKKALDKDDFLKIMLTQMKHQDPTNPFKAEQMATEIAQFTTVEQLQNVNNNIKALSGQNQPVERMAMAGMIGKIVTVDKDRFPHIEGKKEALNFVLPRDAAELRVALVSDTGETVYEKDMGATKAGVVDISWDGIKTNTLPAKSGNYMLRIDAKDPRGAGIDTNPQAQAKIIGVSFEGGEPVFLVGDHRRQDKVTMRNIIRIESDPGQVQMPGAPAAPKAAAPILPPAAPVQVQAQPHEPIAVPAQMQEPAQTEAARVASPESAPAPAPALAPHNLFTFQKGVGSQPLDSSAMTPEVRAALEKLESERGFANGLKDVEDLPTPEAQKAAEQASEARRLALGGERGAPPLNSQGNFSKPFILGKGGEVK